MTDSQLLLPFAERDYIDIPHTCRILGTTWNTVYRLQQKKKIKIIDYRFRSWKRVHYRSLVDFCDELRRVYCIPDRKPQLAAGFLRYRDEDLLPFPLKDTITMKEALSALGRNNFLTVEALIEEGKIEGYRLMPKSMWRISRSSMITYLNSVFHPSL